MRSDAHAVNCQSTPCNARRTGRRSFDSFTLSVITFRQQTKSRVLSVTFTRVNSRASLRVAFVIKTPNQTDAQHSSRINISGPQLSACAIHFAPLVCFAFYLRGWLSHRRTLSNDGLRNDFCNRHFRSTHWHARCCAAPVAIEGGRSRFEDFIQDSSTHHTDTASPGTYPRRGLRLPTRVDPYESGATTCCNAVAERCRGRRMGGRERFVQSVGD